jgi:hypothetical protein
MLTGWDATELKNFELQDGTTFDIIVGQLRAALAALSAEMQSDPLWSGMVSYTDQPDLEYRVGASNGFETFTEYSRPTAARAATEGHMLPLLAFDRGLGWTWDYLRKARMSQIQADIADAIKDARDKWRVQILTRCLQRGDDSGAANGLGSSGYSPGFATAAASTSVDFNPPAYGGTSFDTSHEHCVGIAGGAYTNAVFQDAYDELREHGHMPPFDFLVGTDHRPEIEALTDTVVVGDPLVQYGALQDRAGVDPMQYFAVSNHFRIREVRGVPQYYGFGYKSYGPNSQRNPLRIRLQKGVTAPSVQAFPDPRSGAGAVYPLQFLTLFLEFGVGVADRTAGTPRYVNNATWADGTPT